MKKIGIIFLIIFIAVFAMNCTQNGSNKDIKVTGIAFEEKEYSYDLHSTSALQLDVSFTPENATNKKLQFSVDDSEIASIDSTSGRVTPKSFGEVIVTVKSEEDSKITATCVVNITVEYEKLYPGNFIYYGDYPQRKLDKDYTYYKGINDSKTIENGYTTYSKVSSNSIKYKYEKYNSEIYAVEPLRYDLLSQNGSGYSFISTKIFDARQFNSQDKLATSNDFEKSDLKVWLNGTEAGQYKYKAMISTDDETTVSLASVQEIENYSSKIGKCTDYAVARGVSILTASTPDYTSAYSAYLDNANYWLIDKGGIFAEAAYVRFDGIVYNFGKNVTQSNFGVRAKVALSFN